MLNIFFFPRWYLNNTKVIAVHCFILLFGWKLWIPNSWFLRLIFIKLIGNSKNGSSIFFKSIWSTSQNDSFPQMNLLNVFKVKFLSLFLNTYKVELLVKKYKKWRAIFSSIWRWNIFPGYAFGLSRYFWALPQWCDWKHLNRFSLFLFYISPIRLC